MKPIMIALWGLALPLFASAGTLKQDFDLLNRQAKGPFGLNMLQGTASRTSVKSGQFPANFLFQAAYRNEAARGLAEQHGFYTGNLFTTNYYELMGEFVYGDPYGNHPLEHRKLVENGAAALEKARKMVQHWVLEKHYVQHFHSSRISRSFKLRGIGGSEFEQPYARHFFNFYLSVIRDEFDYLPAFLLVSLSPIVDSASLARARDLITTVYEHFKGRLGANDPMVAALYRLRNAIHNQLTRDVIRQIDKFAEDFPLYRREGHTYLFEIRRILADYFSFGAEKIAAQARTLGFSDLESAAVKLQRSGADPRALLALSTQAASLRVLIANQRLPFEKRAETLALLSGTSRYLTRELSEISPAGRPEVIEAVVNTIFTEGFLIRDNWEYFRAEARSSRSPATLLHDLIDVASGSSGSTLQEAFSPALRLWESVEPRMSYFIDNTIKSSSLSAAAAVAQKLNR